MNRQQIIDAKIAQLSGHDSAPMTDKQQSIIDADPALQRELAFIQTLWQPDSIQLAQPSAQLDERFYTMLAGAQSVLPKKHVTKPSIFSRLKDTLSWRLVWQAGALSAVFLLGLNLNNVRDSQSYQTQLGSLHQQISSLNTMMAISMLQQPSASERLAGIAFTQKADLHHQELATLLLDVLLNDNAAPVKLAVINSLTGSSIEHLEPQLIHIASQEQHVLVQLELTRLLLTKGSRETVNELITQLQLTNLHPDVEMLIQQAASNDTI